MKKASVVLMGLLVTSVLLVAFPTKVIHAAGDDEPPKIRWLDATLKDGLNTIQVGLKDDSAITKKEITYTRYDEIFDEYDEFTVALVPTTTANIYKADIVVHPPHTDIELEVEDEHGNEDDSKKRFEIIPHTYDVVMQLKTTTIAEGSTPVVTVINGHGFVLPVKLDVTFTGLSSSYRVTVQEKVPAVGSKAITIPVSVSPSDRMKTASMRVVLTVYDLTKDETYSGLVFDGQTQPNQPPSQQPPPQNNGGSQGGSGLKGRYERMSIQAGTVDLKQNVARAVFILQPGDSVITPSGINLGTEVFADSTVFNKWVDHIYLMPNDTPIDVKGYRFASDGRMIFIIEVPEIGLHTVSKPGTLLLRYYV